MLLPFPPAGRGSAEPVRESPTYTGEAKRSLVIEGISAHGPSLREQRPSLNGENGRYGNTVIA